LKLPQLDRLVVRGEHEEGAVDGLAPPKAIDLLLNLQTLQVVELSLVTLVLMPLPVLHGLTPGRGGLVITGASTKESAAHHAAGGGAGPTVEACGGDVALGKDPDAARAVAGGEVVTRRVEFDG